MKTIVIAGGTGFIGQALQNHFANQGDKVIVLGRKTKKHNPSNYKVWDGKTLDKWQESLEKADVLINLSGKSVNCRYTPKNKEVLVASRIESTQILQQAVSNCIHPPKIWLNASTATIYEDSRTETNTEDSTRIGTDFSMSLAKKWEDTFFKISNSSTRKVALRISLVLSPKGGVLPVLTRLARLGFGGKMGDGQQKFAHIYLEELLQMIDFIIETPTLHGPVNCTNMLDINNEEFMKQLRFKHRIIGYLNTPNWLLTLGGKIIGTEKELILKSRYVFPKKLLEAGFSFTHRSA